MTLVLILYASCLALSIISVALAGMAFYYVHKWDSAVRPIVKWLYPIASGLKERGVTADALFADTPPVGFEKH